MNKINENHLKSAIQKEDLRVQRANEKINIFGISGWWVLPDTTGIIKK